MTDSEQKETYKSLLQDIVFDASSTGCAGVYTVSAELIDKAIEFLDNDNK